MSLSFFHAHEHIRLVRRVGGRNAGLAAIGKVHRLVLEVLGQGEYRGGQHFFLHLEVHEAREPAEEKEADEGKEKGEADLKIHASRAPATRGPAPQS